MRINVGAGSTPFMWMYMSFASLVSILSTLAIVALASVCDTVKLGERVDSIAAATTFGRRVRRDVTGAYRRSPNDRDDPALSSLALNVGTSRVVERVKA